MLRSTRYWTTASSAANIAVTSALQPCHAQAPTAASLLQNFAQHLLLTVPLVALLQPCAHTPLQHLLDLWVTLRTQVTFSHTDQPPATPAQKGV